MIVYILPNSKVPPSNGESPPNTTTTTPSANFEMIDDLDKFVFR